MLQSKRDTQTGSVHIRWSLPPPSGLMKRGSRLGQIEAETPPPEQPIAESSEGNAREGDQKSSSLSEAW